ncbi:MAG: tail fiber domain-containing protein [bacterium]|nr:tail fiber domain-containing protein [bacterium]
MRHYIKPFMTTIFVVFCLAAIPAFADDCNQEHFNAVAEASIGSGGIYFQAGVSYKQLQLTVSCPDGKVFSRTFTPGSMPYIGLSDPDGKALPDGSYTYELRAFQARTKNRNADDAGLSADTGPKPERLRQTGYFAVRGGAIVVPNAVGEERGPALRGDEGGGQTIADDLIVDGSLCVGTDCAAGIAFGFCTLILKENNLTICFEDTSTTASYPTTDWRIQINSTTNAGGEYFAVRDMDAGTWPFTIEADTGSNTLYVDSNERVGLGTSTPALNLHIVEGNTPSLRLEQDGSSGFNPQVWDVAGNESGFFIRDVTNSSTLPFRIRPGASSSVIDIQADDEIWFGGSGSSAEMVLEADGNLGIGTTTPSQILHVVTPSVNVGLFETSGTECWFLLENSTSGDYNSVGVGSIGDALRLRAGDAERIRILASGNVGIGTLAPSYPLEMGSGAHCTAGGVWTNGSSRQYKENILNLDAELAFSTLEALQPVTFTYKKEKDEQYVGFIAEDVPELVAQTDRKSLSTMDVAAVLTKVTQEQQKFITLLQKEQKEHLELIKRLNKRIIKLEQSRK